MFLEILINKFSKKSRALALLFLCLNLEAFAESIKSLRDDVKVGAFLDTYYAYDFNRPRNLEREYTTQPARHNEANINLAFIDFKLEKEKIRSRLALQYGTSVTKNYATDPVLGSTSGPDKSRMLQEAFVGAKLNEKLWLDFGIYFGHIGMESWISSHNMTYSRSLMLDYVPYYTSGARLTYLINSSDHLQFHLMNGWQNISENNQEKAVGLQYLNKINDSNTFIYNNFFGRERRSAVDPTRLKTYHDFIWKKSINEKWKLNSAIDLGTQKRFDRDGHAIWFVLAQVLQFNFREHKSVSGRVEYYQDKEQANVVTGSMHGFKTLGLSFNYDHKLYDEVLWRSEIRGFKTKDPIFPSHDGFNERDYVLTTSLSIEI